MLIECILIGSSLCNGLAAKPKHADVLPKRQSAIVSMLRDRPVMALAALDLAVKTMDYRQTETDFKLGGFQEHDAMLRPMLGHSVAITAYGTAYAVGAAFPGPRDAHFTFQDRAQAVVAAADHQYRAERFRIRLHACALPAISSTEPMASQNGIDQRKDAVGRNFWQTGGVTRVRGKEMLRRAMDWEVTASLC